MLQRFSNPTGSADHNVCESVARSDVVALPAPMPPEAPVITATLPLNLSDVLLLILTFLYLARMQRSNSCDSYFIGSV